MQRTALVIALTMLGACTSPTTPASEAPAAARRFVETSGDVRIDGQPASAGLAIGEAARIVTGADGRALFTVQPGSIIELRANSQLQLNPNGSRRNSLQLLSGILWSILPAGKADYEVTTRNAVAGVRGTTFYLDATQPDTSVLCLCQGEVDLDAGTTSDQHLHTGADEHTGYRITGEGAAAKLEKLGTMQDSDSHPNARREALRALAPK